MPNTWDYFLIANITLYVCQEYGGHAFSDALVCRYNILMCLNGFHSVGGDSLFWKKNYENRVDIGLYIRNKILLECAKQHKNHTKHPELKDITIKQSVLIFRSPWTIKVFHWLRNSTWLTVLQSTKIVVQTCITIIHHDLLSCQLPINTSDRAKIHLLQSCKCDVTLEAIVIL